MGIITDSIDESQMLLARTQRFATDQLRHHPDASLLPRLIQAHQFALAITSKETADSELISLTILLHSLTPEAVTDFLQNEFYPPEKLAQLQSLIKELNSSASTTPATFTTPEAQIAHDALRLTTLIYGQ